MYSERITFCTPTLPGPAPSVGRCRILWYPFLGIFNFFSTKTKCGSDYNTKYYIMKE